MNEKKAGAVDAAVSAISDAKKSWNNPGLWTIGASSAAASPHPDEPLLLRAEAAHHRFRAEALEAYARILVLLLKDRGIDVPLFPELVK